MSDCTIIYKLVQTAKPDRQEALQSIRVAEEARTMSKEDRVEAKQQTRKTKDQ